MADVICSRCGRWIPYVVSPKAATFATGAGRQQILCLRCLNAQRKREKDATGGESDQKNDRTER